MKVSLIAGACCVCRVCAVLTGAHTCAADSIGWAAGPLMGGLLYEALQTHPLCTGAEPQRWP